jgi:hypothetical protein
MAYNEIKYVNLIIINIFLMFHIFSHTFPGASHDISVAVFLQIRILNCVLSLFPLALYYGQTHLEAWRCIVSKPKTRKTGHACATCFTANWSRCQSPWQFAWSHACLVLRNWRYLKLSLLHFSVTYHESQHVFLQIVVSRWMKLGAWSRVVHWAGPVRYVQTFCWASNTSHSIEYPTTEPKSSIPLILEPDPGPNIESV